MRRPSTTKLIGVASGVLLLAGGVWVGADALTGSSPKRPTSSPRATETTVSEQLLPADDSTSADESTTSSPDNTHSDALPAAPADPLASLDGVTVAIDPGHNGGNAAHPEQIGRAVDAGGFRKACDTTGTAASDGTTESSFNFDVAHRLGTILKRAGATVSYTRPNDTGVGPCINRRAELTNAADVAISIHADGNTSDGAHGFHVIAPATTNARSAAAARDSEALGGAVRDALNRVDGLTAATYVGHDGIDVRDDLGGLNLSTVPKVMVEAGNMKSADDMRVLGSSRGRAAIARAMARGLAAWLAVRQASSDAAF